MNLVKTLLSDSATSRFRKAIRTHERQRAQQKPPVYRESFGKCMTSCLNGKQNGRLNQTPEAPLFLTQTSLVSISINSRQTWNAMTLMTKLRLIIKRASHRK